MPEFSGAHCEVYSEKILGAAGGNAAAIFIPILIVMLVGIAIGLFFVVKKRPL